MTINLNHTIVPARNKRAAAQFFSRIFGLHADPKDGHFAPVRVNDTRTLLFDDGSHPSCRRPLGIDQAGSYRRLNWPVTASS